MVHHGSFVVLWQEIRDKVKLLEGQKRLTFTEGNDMKNRYNNIKPCQPNNIHLHFMMSFCVTRQAQPREIAVPE